MKEFSIFLIYLISFLKVRIIIKFHFLDMKNFTVSFMMSDSHHIEMDNASNFQGNNTCKSMDDLSFSLDNLPDQLIRGEYNLHFKNLPSCKQDCSSDISNKEVSTCLTHYQLRI